MVIHPTGDTIMIITPQSRLVLDLDLLHLTTIPTGHIHTGGAVIAGIIPIHTTVIHPIIIHHIIVTILVTIIHPIITDIPRELILIIEHEQNIFQELETGAAEEIMVIQEEIL